MVSCNFIGLKRTLKVFVVSLVDPFLVDCIVFDKDTTHYSTSKFHDINGIHQNDVDVNNALCCPTPAALSA